MPARNESAVLEAVFHAAVDAIVVADAAGVIHRVNAAANQMFGYKGDLVGRNIKALMPQRIASQHDKFMHLHMTTGKRRILEQGQEVTAIRANGTEFPAGLTVARTDIEGDAIFIAVIHDLTERKAAEAQLARSQRLDAIGQMTGGVAHDFNNILTVVIGNMELLQMKYGNTQGAELVNEALEAAELGSKLTGQLLTFASRSLLAPKTLNLNTKCEEILNILRRTIGVTIDIKTVFEPNLWNVTLDPTQLQTAVMNLAFNARDAMPKGGRLTFETSNVTVDDDYIAQELDIAKGHYVRLAISDTGTGMTPEQQAKAFEPFFTTKGVGEGTGLGLSMVYGFVSQSKGSVSLYSEIGSGTTFGLYFPAPTAGMAETVAKVPLVDENVGTGRLLLVVEDDARVRRLTCERLRSLGFRCAEAATADSAWQVLQTRDDVDGVFSDIVMPGEMSGLDLARKIKGKQPDIPVVLTSGYSSEAVMASTADVGEFPLLRKPYRLAELAQTWRLVLSHAPER